MELNGRVLFKFTELSGRDAGVREGWNLPEGDDPGGWMPDVVGPLGGFGVGYRLATLAELPACVGRELYVAEGAGGAMYDGPIVVCRRARLVRRLDGWDRSVAEGVARSAASRVAAYYSRNGWVLGELPMAVQDVLTRDETRDWLGSARDDLRLCAGLIANAAGRISIERCGEAGTVEQVGASAYQREMAVERGHQVAELLVKVWSPEWRDAC